MRTDLDELKELIDYEYILSHYEINGYASGNQFIGLCPFHNDTKNSFGMNLTNGVWNCFTCKESGNIFTFVQKIENLEKFKDAIHILKKITGYNGFVPDLDYTKKLIEKFNNCSDKYREEYLSEIKEIILPIEFKSAIRHLSVVRKRVTPIMIRKFKIAYAAEGYYKDHMIIPIYFNKQLVSFFARDMSGMVKKSKKYNKGAPISQVFFNWDNAIENDNYVVLTEGIIDCIKVDSYEYNCMALLGIQLSKKKKLMLIEKFQKVYISLDNDDKEKDGKKTNPGQEAALRIAKELRDEINVYNIVLPKGKDPDECTKFEFDLAFKNALKI